VIAGLTQTPHSTKVLPRIDASRTGADSNQLSESADMEMA